MAFKPAQPARRESFKPAVTLDFALDDVSEAEMAVTRIRAAQASPTGPICES